MNSKIEAKHESKHHHHHHHHHHHEGSSASEQHSEQSFHSEKSSENIMASLANEKGAPSITEKLVLEHPSYKELAEKLTEAERKVSEYWNKVLRAQAEVENLHRRVERDIANAHKYALDKFAGELLPIVDNLERCLLAKVEDQAVLKDFHDGIALTLKLFLETLKKHGITQINPLGEVFNPDQHTAMTTREIPGAVSNTVLEVMQKGYWLKDRLLRPALVVVAK